jgi:hypothetical protein
MKVVANYGMGVDSTVIVHRWLTDPTCRDFPLEDLVIVSAQVGDEFSDTKRMVERHVLPLFRRHGVRYVQLARNGPRQEDGITVLSDTRAPFTLHTGGVYRLSDELTAAGTVPQVASRRCSAKYKGWVIDTWLLQEMNGEPFRQVMGFNADEQRRVDRDQCYGGENRNAVYPLMAWKWGRAACEAYLREKTGADWPKSCCSMCPFANGKPAILARYRAMPEQAADALLLEHLSTALNPNMTLYRDRSLWSVLEADGQAEAFRIFTDRVARMSWAVYRVRRIYTRKGGADRAVEKLRLGNREEALDDLHAEATRRGLAVEETANSPRLYVSRLQPGVYPTTEEMWVAAPALADDKAKEGFEQAWGWFSLDLVA